MFGIAMPHVDGELDTKCARSRPSSSRQRPRMRLWYILVFGIVLLLINLEWQFSEPDPPPLDPEVWITIKEPKGTGGRWRIPNRWLLEDTHLPPGVSRSPKTSLEAAELALALSLSQGRFIRHSSIPLIVHQTWRTMDFDLWSPQIIQAVGTWLSHCDGDKTIGGVDIAYILWDDEGMKAFMEQYEPDFFDTFSSLPSMVERTDVFRVLVLKWFGGVYGDIDTQPIKPPASWVFDSDLVSWTDTLSNTTFAPKSPIPIYPYPTNFPPSYTLPDIPSNLAHAANRSTTSHSNTPGYHHKTPISSAEIQSKFDEPLIAAIFGIEADFPPESDSYWRAGYGFSTQLTNWALAMAPHHPVALRFQEEVRARVEEDREGLMTAYAVDLTGPVMITRVVSEWLADSAGLRWNAVSGLTDGWKSKAVNDVLILAQHGFHPRLGRHFLIGGAKDQAARLSHFAQGSWRKFDPQVEVGKLCRTLFGLCREWGKERPIVQPLTE